MLKVEEKETGEPKWVRSGGGRRGLQQLPGQPLLFLVHLEKDKIKKSDPNEMGHSFCVTESLNSTLPFKLPFSEEIPYSS